MSGRGAPLSPFILGGYFMTAIMDYIGYIFELTFTTVNEFTVTCGAIIVVGLLLMLISLIFGRSAES